MFVSSEHQPQLLGAEWYHSAERFQQEQEHVFLPTWQCVAAAGEMPNDGDFKTFELCGRPLIVRRDQGEYRTFLNVCSHRFCKLTEADCGSMPQLRCQYHGWEFDAEGDTRKIPDAASFKPLAPGMLGLTKVRTQRCGQLIFVTLNDDAPRLAEFLGDNFDRFAEWYHDDLAFIGHIIREVDVNWKVITENALESYHLTERHGKTFGPTPPAERCRHELHESWSQLTVDYSADRTFLTQLDSLVNWWNGTQQQFEFQQVHVQPNLLFSRLSFNRWFETVIPISPTRSHHLGVAFADLGRPPGLRSRLAFPFMKRWANRWHERTNAEDRPVLLATQHGLESSEHPRGGLISTREERLIHLQQHVLDRTGQSQGESSFSNEQGVCQSDAVIPK